MQFLHQEEENKISLNVGIGTGGTMNDAEMNARRALDFSLKNAKQEIFWIMNKIMEADYGKVYAKKTAAAGGRPKALVEILFKIHCKWSFIRTRVDEQ